MPLPSLHLSQIDADKEESSKPIQLGPPIEITYRFKLSLPSKYQARLPLPLTVSRDYAEYSSTYKMEGNTLIAERKFRLRQHELPAARVQDYRPLLPPLAPMKRKQFRWKQAWPARRQFPIQ